MMKCIIWGVGEKLHKNIDKICMDEVCAFVDRNQDKHYSEIYGIKVLPPEKILELEFDFIVIFVTKYFVQIAQELIFQYGVESNKILSWKAFLQSEEQKKLELLRQVKKMCISYGVKNILDINAVLETVHYVDVHNNTKPDVWLQRDVSLGFLENKYDTVYTSREQINKKYDLVITDAQIEECDSLALKNAGCTILLGIPETDDIDYKNLNIGGIRAFVSYDDNKSIRVYQVTHRHFIPVSDWPYKPIHAGKIGKQSLGFLGDDTGDNISDYNHILNECTALYWIWKNDSSEYIGLNHYRRLFGSFVNKGWMLQEWEMRLLLGQYDIIVAEGYDTGELTVEELLRTQVCEEAFEVTYNALKDILRERGNQDEQAFQYIMQGYMIYPCNMFLTTHEILNSYCSWLFPILFQLIQKVEIKEEWDSYSKRIIGFFAERFLTVWLVQQKLKIKEMPILLLDDGRPYGM